MEDWTGFEGSYQPSQKRLDVVLSEGREERIRESYQPNTEKKSYQPRQSQQQNGNGTPPSGGSNVQPPPAKPEKSGS